MPNDKLKQQNEENSLGLQAGRDVNITTNEGITYENARQIAYDVYRANILELQNIAADIAEQRMQLLLNKLFAVIKKHPHSQNIINSFCDPGVQDALFNTQKEYAKSPDEDIRKLSLNLLIERMQKQNRTLEQIVLDESLRVVMKLTKNQCNALSLLFLLKYSTNKRVNGIDKLMNYFDKFFMPLISYLPTKNSDYQHLEYAGCINVNHLTNTSIFACLLSNYSGLFCKGFSQDTLSNSLPNIDIPKEMLTTSLHNKELLQINASNEKVIEQLCNKYKIAEDTRNKIIALQRSKLMNKVEIEKFLLQKNGKLTNIFSIWSNSYLKFATLNSVGIAIAIANIQEYADENFDLSNWI